ncbi:MAG: hypothetical protein GX761_07445 [Gammaproteobacteria bacterium]|nr:hypothetical protein [Gammaproteobacteria bacterium]
MSSIGSDPHLNLTGLGGLGGQVAFDDLQGRPQHGPQQADALREAGLSTPAAAPVDAGEAMLLAEAWGNAPEGSRMLSGDPSLESALGAMDLSAAADGAVDAILSGLGHG